MGLLNEIEILIAEKKKEEELNNNNPDKNKILQISRKIQEKINNSTDSEKHGILQSLRTAAPKGDIKTVQTIMDISEAGNIQGWGGIALKAAASRGKKDVVESIFQYVEEQNNKAAIDVNGLSVSQREDLKKQPGYYTQTLTYQEKKEALVEAAKKGHSEIVESIIKKSPENRTEMSNTAIGVKAYPQLQQICDLILKDLTKRRGSKDEKTCKVEEIKNKINNVEKYKEGDIKKLYQELVSVTLKNTGLFNTTTSGKLLKNLINKEEFKTLKEFSKETFKNSYDKNGEKIRYQDLKNIGAGSNFVSFKKEYKNCRENIDEPLKKNTTIKGP